MNFWGNLVKEGAVAVDNDFTADWGHHIGADRYVAMIGAGWSPTYMVDTYLPAGPPSSGQSPRCRSGPPVAHAAANWGGSTNAVTKDAPANLVKDAALFAAFINTSKSGLASTRARRPQPAEAAACSRRRWPGPVCRQFSAPVPAFRGEHQRSVLDLRQRRAGQVRVEPMGHRVRQLRDDADGCCRRWQGELVQGAHQHPVAACLLRPVGRVLGQRLTYGCVRSAKGGGGSRASPAGASARDG